MPDYRKVAKAYIEKGLWVMPVNRFKKPALPNWTELQTRPMTDQEVEKYFKNCFGIALLCGGDPSVELLDWDLKYDLSGDFYDRVKKEIPDSIKRKMFVQTTKNNGFHWIYKLPKERISPNQKLANRYTTSSEKHQVYQEYYKCPKTRDNAMKIAINDSHRVLAETRGGSITNCGGYGLISPTEGYKVVFKPTDGLQELTEQEHDLLLSTVRSFNEVMELGEVIKKKFSATNWEIDPFDDYNDRGDVLSLLEECGWTEVGNTSKSIRLKRPGADSGSSALYDIETGIFNCFSTSTRFECNKGHNKVKVFTELSCDGDSKLTYPKLVSLGFGVVANVPVLA